MPEDGAPDAVLFFVALIPNVQPRTQNSQVASPPNLGSNPVATVRSIAALRPREGLLPAMPLRHQPIVAWPDAAEACFIPAEDAGGWILAEAPAIFRPRHPERTGFYQLFVRSGPPGLRLWRTHADCLLYYRPADRRPHPATSGNRVLSGEGSFRTPCSAARPHPLPTIMPSVAYKPSGCRPGARPVEVCPSTRAISSGKRRTRGRQRIVGLSASQRPTPAWQCAACPEFSRISRLFFPLYPCAPR